MKRTSHYLFAAMARSRATGEVQPIEMPMSATECNRKYNECRRCHEYCLAQGVWDCPRSN